MTDTTIGTTDPTPAPGAAPADTTMAVPVVNVPVGPPVKPDWTPRVLALLSLVLFYAFAAWVIHDNHDLALINLVIGQAGGFVSGGIGYYFGTTASHTQRGVSAN